MSDPKLYKMGMDNTNFGAKVFWSWILYAFWQALLVLVFVFLCSQSVQASLLENGKPYTLWSGGMMCYGTCVLLVNSTIIKLHNNYTGCLEGLAVVNVATFWIFVAGESKGPMFGALYKNWEEYVASPAVWLGMILVTLSVFSVDLVFRLLLATITAACRKQPYKGKQFMMF